MSLRTSGPSITFTFRVRDGDVKQHEKKRRVERSLANADLTKRNYSSKRKEKKKKKKWGPNASSPRGESLTVGP